MSPAARALTLAAILAVAGAGFSAFTKSDVRRQQTYTRLVATYEVKATHETVVVDAAVSCQNILRYDKTGDRSVEMVAGTNQFAKVTKSHSAIMVTVPSLCGVISESRVPADFLPHAVWFDNADDFSFGVMALTSEAYASQKSAISFKGASLRSIDEVEYEEWRKQVREDFIPSSVVRRPYGFSCDELWVVTKGEDRSIRSGDLKLPIAKECHGIQKLLVPEGLRSEFDSLRPISKPRYWSQYSVDWGATSLFDKLWRTRPLPTDLINGRTYRDSVYTATHGEQTIGLPTIGGGGHIPLRKVRKEPGDIYPMSIKIDSSAIGLDAVVNFEMSEGEKGFAHCFSMYGFLKAHGISNPYAARIGCLISGEPVWARSEPCEGITNPEDMMEDDIYYLSRFMYAP